jgi:hypothetical protein
VGGGFAVAFGRRLVIHESSPMTLSRVRFTIRRMMVAVAIVALAVAAIDRLPRRSEGFRQRASFYLRQVEKSGHTWHPAAAGLAYQGKKWYFNDMVQKYVFAASFPFLPVWPDPPDPE